MKEDKYYKTSILDWIMSLWGYARRYTPEFCALCGLKRRGNFITGYYFNCEEYFDHY